MAALSDRCEVLIAGAGLAGLWCARELAARGVAAVLLDRKKQVGDGVHTTGIFVRRSLEQFALPPSTLGPPIRRVELYSPRRRRLLLESPREEFRVGRMPRLYERLLEDCVAAGVRWLPETRYLGSEPRAGGSRVVFERRGKLGDISAGFVIGADGASSRVARDLRLSRNRRWIIGAEEVLEGVPLDGPPRFLCFLDPETAPGYIAWAIHDGEETHLGVGGYPERFQPGRALAAFRSEVARALDLGRGTILERRGGRIPVGGLLARVVCSRGLLVGDAAGAPSPLTAGGFDAALRLARRAADVVHRRLSGETDALASYPGRALDRAPIWPQAMRGLMSHLRSPILLEAACALLRIPPLKRFARRVFFGGPECLI
jgi:flavin-dependent dehydrogenase